MKLRERRERQQRLCENDEALAQQVKVTLKEIPLPVFNFIIAWLWLSSLSTSTDQYTSSLVTSFSLS